MLKLVTGDTPKDERAETLHELAYGDLEVVVNVSVLTEGFDAPACVLYRSYEAMLTEGYDGSNDWSWVTHD